MGCGGSGHKTWHLLCRHLRERHVLVVSLGSANPPKCIVNDESGAQTRSRRLSARTEKRRTGMM